MAQFVGVFGRELFGSRYREPNSYVSVCFMVAHHVPININCLLNAIWSDNEFNQSNASVGIFDIANFV